jgi:ferrous iron transport protein A
MTLFDCELGKQYTVASVGTGDEELEQFLFSLGCYRGEPVTVISRRKSSCVIAVKDGRYSIDRALASAIGVE